MSRGRFLKWWRAAWDHIYSWRTAYLYAHDGIFWTEDIRVGWAEKWVKAGQKKRTGTGETEGELFEGWYMRTEIKLRRGRSFSDADFWRAWEKKISGRWNEQKLWRKSIEKSNYLCFGGALGGYLCFGGAFR